MKAHHHAYEYIVGGGVGFVCSCGETLSASEWLKRWEKARRARELASQEKDTTANTDSRELVGGSTL